jgi:hypothetical protein
MRVITETHKVMSKHQHKARFAIVYIVEAHPTDGWFFDGQAGRHVATAKDMEERAQYCRDMREDTKCCVPLMVDDVTFPCGDAAHANRCSGPNYERVYATWPMRFYAFGKRGDEHRILFKGNHFGVSPQSVPGMFVFLSEFLDSL